MRQLMGINGERILVFGTRIVREMFRINEAMRDIDLSLCPPHFGKELN